MTEEDVIKIVTSGTTEYRKGRVKCLHLDSVFALVKWPGESLSCNGFRDYVSPWVVRYDVSYLKANPPKSHVAGTTVWECGRDQNGPLTKKRLKALIEREAEVLRSPERVRLWQVPIIPTRTPTQWD